MSVKIKTIVEWAQRLKGLPYVFGTEQDGKKKPTAEDCSELIENACDQNEVLPQMPDGAMYQIRHCQKQGTLIPVEEGINTYGALLFSFSDDPFEGDRPDHSHVAFSLGNGKTFEARGRAWGVGSWSAKDRFNYAALIPGAEYPSKEV